MAGVEQGTRQALLVGCLLSVTLHAFDELSVLTALPIIVSDLEGRELYGAVFFAYLLASLLGLVAAGWQADRHGPRRPFAFGLGVFLVGLAFGAIAPTMEALVAARAIQGLGGGVISTVVLYVVSRVYDDHERPRVMALISAAWTVPALLAPAGAGAIAEYVGWRWIFVLLMPLVVLAAALALPSIGRLGPGGTERADEGAWGSALEGLRIAVGVGLVLAALGREASLLTGLALIGGIALAFTPLRRVLPRGVWRAQPMLGAAIALKTIVVFAFFGAEAFLPLALIEIHDTSASYAGLALTSAALSWTAAAFLQSRLAPNVSAPRLAAAGCAGLSVALGGLLLLLDPSMPAWLAFVCWCIGGAGIGLAYNTLNVAAMASTSAGSEGRTSTALGVADALGISVATGIGGAIVGLGDRAGRGTGDSLELVWGLMLGVTLLSLLITRRLVPAATNDPQSVSGAGSYVVGRSR